MPGAQPLIFNRPQWWYIFSGSMLLLTGGAILFVLLHYGSPDKPGAKPTLSVIGSLLVVGAVGFFGFRCRTIIDFADNQVTYEWSTLFIRHREVYPLGDVRHVGLRRGTSPPVSTHHVFLAIDKRGQSVRIELQEIVYHRDAAERGREVARILGKPFVDCTVG
jgi:hypothetical protein